jgi:hypothetical protein
MFLCLNQKVTRIQKFAQWMLFFHAMFQELWESVEGFSGKRPLGNSYWDYMIIESVQEVMQEPADSKTVQKLISQALTELFMARP